MDLTTPDLSSWPAKLVIRVGRRLRSKKDFTQNAIDRDNAKAAERRRQRRVLHANKNHYLARDPDHLRRNSFEVDELGERVQSVFSEASTLVEQKDHTDMMHRLAHHDSFDSLVDKTVDKGQSRDVDVDVDAHVDVLRRVSTKDERMVASLPDEVWQRITSFLNPLDAAHLAQASQTLRARLGSEPFDALIRPENRHYRIAFLHAQDSKLPRHLLCFPCAKYHLRSRPGKESLKMDFVNNPLFDCPAAKTSVLPRIRLAHGRELPYSFVQLALRDDRHSPAHGISCAALARSWKSASSAWSYRTQYMVHDSRLLVRVASRAFTPPAATLTETVERHLLYDREEYVPFFSVCAHWRDGDLLKICKCAMSHVPAPPDGYLQQLRRAPKISRSAANPHFIVTMCDFCRPARRCPECPTEYLVEIQMVEDATDAVRPFKHAIVVTRWSDLGDGSSPYTGPEWAAIKGLDTNNDGQGYESFSHVGRRAVGGIFESRMSGSVPGKSIDDIQFPRYWLTHIPLIPQARGC